MAGNNGAARDGLECDQVVDLPKLEQACRMILESIGEDPNREGLVETPARFARFWKEFIQYNPGNVDTAFEAVTADQLVVVSGMQVWSLCEHHLLPLHCMVSIGYLTGGKILGLSKFGRVAHWAAHRLQVQERLVTDVAIAISQLLDGNPDVAVIARGEHLCMTMRGIKTPAMMTSSFLGGKFRESGPLRQEFLDIALKMPCNL